MSEFFTVPQVRDEVARRTGRSVSHWTVRRIIDELDPTVKRVGLVRLCPPSLVDRVEQVWRDRTPKGATC